MVGRETCGARPDDVKALLLGRAGLALARPVVKARVHILYEVCQSMQDFGIVVVVEV